MVSYHCEYLDLCCISASGMARDMSLRRGNALPSCHGLIHNIHGFQDLAECSQDAKSYAMVNQ
jgi:hypothetical protein